MLRRLHHLVPAHRAHSRLELRRALRALSAQPDDLGHHGASRHGADREHVAARLDRGKGEPRVSGINLLAGAVAVAILICFTLWGGKQFRRVAMLVGLVLGTLVYALFIPISFGRVI